MSTQIQHEVSPYPTARGSALTRGGMLTAACNAARAVFRAIEAADEDPDMADAGAARTFGPGTRAVVRASYLAPLAIAAALLFAWAGLCAI